MKSNSPTPELPALPNKWFAEARELANGDDYSRGAAAARETLALELQAALRASALAAARGQEDAARYRWLRSQGMGFSHDAEHRGIATSRWGHWPLDTAEGFAAAIDAAIDAAMKDDDHAK
jgi:hypothetical protein